MTPEHFLHIVQAEIVKLFSRLTAKVGLVFAAGISILGPLVMWWISNSQMVINGTKVADKIDKVAPTALIWSLEIRNFFILRAFIIMLVALSFASEYSSRAIREDILRPVPRWSVPMAKWIAVDVWVALSLVVAFVLSSLLGVVVFGFSGDWGRTLLAYLVTLLADVGFASLVLLVAIASRSVAGTIAGVFLFAVLDTAFSAFLSVLGWAVELMNSFLSAGMPGGKEPEIPWIITLALDAKPWLPSSAFGVWRGYLQEASAVDASVMVMTWSWEGFVALAAITLVCAVGSIALFRRLDVP